MIYTGHIPRSHGVFRLVGYDHGARVYDSGPLHNLVVNTGKTLILDRLFGLPGAGVPPAVNSTGIGTDNTAAAATQTKLNPVVTGSTYLSGFDNGFPTIAGLVVNTQTTVGTGNGNFTIWEVALFNGTTNGTSIMLDRVVLGSSFTKTSAITLVITCAFTQL